MPPLKAPNSTKHQIWSSMALLALPLSWETWSKNKTLSPVKPAPMRELLRGKNEILHTAVRRGQVSRSKASHCVISELSCQQSFSLDDYSEQIMHRSLSGWTTGSSSASSSSGKWSLQRATMGTRQWHYLWLAQSAKNSVISYAPVCQRSHEQMVPLKKHRSSNRGRGLACAGDKPFRKYEENVSHTED